MLTFLRSRSRWIVAPVAGVTAVAALATVALASGSFPGDFVNAANAANTTHRTCPVTPHPAVKTATPCGQGIAAFIQRERQLAAGSNSRLPERMPAGVSGPVQSPVSAAEQARLRNLRQARTALWGG